MSQYQLQSALVAGALALTPVGVHSSSDTLRLTKVERASRATLSSPVVAASVMQLGGVGELDDNEQDLLTEDDVRAYVSQLWAEDWDSPEDRIYDRM